jgi:hypothetical protein
MNGKKEGRKWEGRRKERRKKRQEEGRKKEEEEEGRKEERYNETVEFRIQRVGRNAFAAGTGYLYNLSIS